MKNLLCSVWISWTVLACGGQAVLDGDGGETTTTGSGDTTSNVGTTATGTTPTTSQPDPEPTCESLEAQYRDAVVDARACEPTLGGNPCDGFVQEAIICGCPIPYNSRNRDALSTLTDLLATYESLGCDLAVECPDVDCGGFGGPPFCGLDGLCREADF